MAEVRPLLCLGWDVGGWHGAKDGLAALIKEGSGRLAPVGKTSCCSLGRLIACGDFSLETLLDRLGLDPDEYEAHRIVLGVDAPFGLPRAFVQSLGREIDSWTVPPDVCDAGFIENVLAYRFTDRRIHQATGKRPLSASLDSLTNNVTKARAGIASFRVRSGFRIVPFDRDDGARAIVEVYPALWKTWLLSREAEDLAALANGADSVDERDAVICAIAAGAYECTRTEAHCGLPAVAMAPAEEAVATEGWIYAPI